MTLIFVAPPPPVVVRVISSGPNWLTFVLSLVGTFVVGTATALLIQLYVVPRVETRKRREDRWERDVRELSELLTTLLSDRAAIGFLTTSKPPRQADPLVGLMVVVSIPIVVDLPTQ